ncbi:MAG TPA: glutamine--fructose-6-phosphate transaminase (isomerizing) [Candidatus Altiarchaeales archaeon]|nr:glutamine--fructose-6-phosphate transaminase (isomerizing) [Candidatus Altiarchaeales archaeon]
MCGITGYVGGRNATEVLFEMLKRLEYRGYDSAGIAYVTENGIRVPKDRGAVSAVEKSLDLKGVSSNIGVGHTRWATHGAPSQINSHPHPDCTGDFVVAHNGIIENYIQLKSELEELGHKFKSETDTEVVAHLIEQYYDGDLLNALEKTLARLQGSYALTVLSSKHLDRILVARLKSPMIIGFGVGEMFVASDAPAFMKYTKKVHIMRDGEYGEITKDGAVIFNDGKKISVKAQELDWSVEAAEKGGFPHFMLKEIMEEPASAEHALTSIAKISEVAKKIAKKKRIMFVACGTAYHAGMVGKYVLENFGVEAEAEVASEFRYSTAKTVNQDTALIVVSQSGETADTLAAIEEAKNKGAYVLGIVNVVGSSITRVADDTVYIQSGPEIAVASTKAYIGQSILTTLLALHIAFSKEFISKDKLDGFLREAKSLPGKIQKILSDNNLKSLAEKCANTRTFFYIGRTLNYPTALEGALKIKEIAYVHAEGYAAGELKHGPLAVLDEETVVIAIKSGKNLSDKMDSNIQEAKARRATVLTVAEYGDIKVPETVDELTPILNIVPLHLFAYYISDLKGLDPDKPRNLAKSVTVE